MKDHPRWLPILAVLLALQLACGLPTAPAEPIPTAALSQPTQPSLPAQPTLTRAPLPQGAAELLQPEDLEYQGAFRLPQGEMRPRTFEYGGGAMTFRMDGDPDGADDGFPGSLFVSAHDRLPYGELPDGSQIAEISIPAPVISKHLNALNRAEFLQDYHNVADRFFREFDELPRLGLLYLNDSATGPKIHLTWGQHMEPEKVNGTHAWLNPDLSAPDVQGPWYLDDLSSYNTTGYLLEIPHDFAVTYADGRLVGSGRFRDGGWSGMGPTLYAYRPWLDDSGTPAKSGTRLETLTLLQYQNSNEAEGIQRALNGYQHPDEWEGGAWITTPGGRTALVFAGTKSNGDKYWYGYRDLKDVNRPCVEVEIIGQFPLCRLRDGALCGNEDLKGCASHDEYRGWWSTHFDAELIFYNPDDLARVALGELQPWEPQPYAVLDIDEHLLLNPDGVEPGMLGTGDQRRYRIGEAAFDRRSGTLYLLEWFADGAAPLVHVWRVK